MSTAQIVLVLAITAPAGILAALTMRSITRDVRRLLASPCDHDAYCADYLSVGYHRGQP